MVDFTYQPKWTLVPSYADKRIHVPDIYSWPYLKETVSHNRGGSDEISEEQETKQKYGFPEKKEILSVGVSFSWISNPS